MFACHDDNVEGCERRACFVIDASYRGVMNLHVIEVTDDELKLMTSALRSYLSDFGHEEADIQRALKRLLAKLSQPAPSK
jgi:hypothetical protein